MLPHPCPGPSSHKSTRTPSSSLRRGATCPPCPPATTVPQPGPASPGLGGGVIGWAPAGWREQRKTTGAAAKAGEPDPGMQEDVAVPAGTQSRGARGEEPTRLLLRRSWGGPRGAHRILTRRPRVSATFTRTAGTGSFRSRFRAGRSRAQTCRGGCGTTATHHPQPHPGFAPSHKEGETPVPGMLGPPTSPVTRPRGGTAALSPLRPPQEPPSSAEPRGPTPRQRDGAAEAAGSAWSRRGGGAARGLWGAGLEPVGLLLHRPGEEKGPQHGGPGPGRGTEPGAEPPGARGAVQTLAGPSLPYQHDFLMPGTAPGSKKTIQVVFPSSKSIIIFFQ